MNFSAKLRFNFHISKRFRGKVTEIVGDSLAARIFTESSRLKKTVLLQNGETSTLQMQHKMTQIEHNHFFVKYQRKSKIFIEKYCKPNAISSSSLECIAEVQRIFYKKTAKKVSHSYEVDTENIGSRHLNIGMRHLFRMKNTIFAT